MEDEDIEEMIEDTIEEHSNCDTVCPENFTTSEEGNERICYGEDQSCVVVCVLLLCIAGL